MRRSVLIVALLSIVMLISSGCERKVTNEVTNIVPAEGAEYVGSEACQSCHADTYASFVNTGHPFKLNEAEDAQVAGYYPYTTIASPPPGVAWADVDKVIGGFWWKARFIGHDGFIITGSDVQYNFATDEFVAYNDGKTKAYDCGPCHMTAYKDTGNQEDKEGLVGTWAFGGIQCEECHGPGSVHAGDPFDVDMVIDRSSESCGKCHIRGDVNKIPASGGFIKHHEQWNEMFTTKHAALECVDCHDPHIGLHPNNPERDAAIKVTCENCHLEETETFLASSIEHAGSSAGPGCVDCHMAKAAKSAVAAGPYEGDIHSHLFRINTDADAEMFNEDGTYANGYLTLEYTCLQCHSSEDKSWAADHAGQVHASPPESVSDCFECHSDEGFGLVLAAIQEEYTQSVHASGENTDRNRHASSRYQGCEKCHTSQGFVAEVTGIPASGDHFSQIDCFGCHEPHTGGNFAVRVQDAVALADGTEFDRGDANLCVSCHQSRRDVNTTVVDGVELSGHWGPHHSNQGDLLIGSNSYEYDGYTYTNSAHSFAATEGCIDCHMSAPRHFSIGGHSWNMRNEDRGFENTTGCNVTGCHNGTLDDLDILAASDFDWDGEVEGIQTEVHGLLDSLGLLLTTAGLIEDGHPVSGRIVTTADSAGALYNYLFIEEDRSFGVHNTDYTIGLLHSAINFLVHGDPNGASGVAALNTRQKPLAAH